MCPTSRPRTTTIWTTTAPEQFAVDLDASAFRFRHRGPVFVRRRPGGHFQLLHQLHDFARRAPHSRCLARDVPTGNWVEVNTKFDKKDIKNLPALVEKLKQEKPDAVSGSSFARWPTPTKRPPPRNLRHWRATTAEGFRRRCPASDARPEQRRQARPEQTRPVKDRGPERHEREEEARSAQQSRTLRRRHLARERKRCWRNASRRRRGRREREDSRRKARTVTEEAGGRRSPSA